MKKTILLILAFVSLLSYVNAQWVQTTTPPGGSVWAMAVIGSKIFAGAGNGGVYFSNNDGTTWLQRDSASPSMEVQSLLAIGNDLYVGTIGNIYKSSDDGITWVNITPTAMIGGPPHSPQIRSLVANSNTIYAGTFGGGGIYMSPISGISSTSWTSFNTGWTYGNFDTRSLKINGTTIYAGTYGKGVWMSPLDTPNWSQTSSTMISSSQYIEAIDINGSIFLAGDISSSPTLYRSTDGINWTQPNISIFGNKPIYSIVHKGDNYYVGTEGTGVFLSKDNGVTWNTFNNGFYVSGIDSFGQKKLACNQINIRSIAFSGTNIYAGTDCGVWKRSLSDTAAGGLISAGINDLKLDEQFSFYPNPAKDFVTIKLSSGLIGSTYKISDQLGRIVMVGKLSSETSTINTNDLNTGIYFVSFGKVESHNFKFLKL